MYFIHLPWLVRIKNCIKIRPCMTHSISFYTIASTVHRVHLECEHCVFYKTVWKTNVVWKQALSRHERSGIDVSNQNFLYLCQPLLFIDSEEQVQDLSSDKPKEIKIGLYGKIYIRKTIRTIWTINKLVCQIFGANCEKQTLSMSIFAGQAWLNKSADPTCPIQRKSQLQKIRADSQILTRHSFTPFLRSNRYVSRM